MDDVLIIGSGFGGAIAAHTLAGAGARVSVLERGPWRDTLPIRSAGIGERAALPRGRRFFSHLTLRLHHRWLPARGLGLHHEGLFEVFAGHGLNIVCASGVGGGSHAYGGLHARPLRDDYWDAVGEGISAHSMSAHYDAVLALLGSRQPHASDRLPAAEPLWPSYPQPFVAATHPHWGYRFPADPGNPTECTEHGITRQEAVFSEEGSFGSPGGGKTTLDVACLLPALRTGNLAIHDRREVLHIEQQHSGSFRVLARHLRSGRQETHRAARVIVAAGTANTVKLLLQSRAAGGLHGMPALGLGLSANADVMAYWPVNRPGADFPACGVYAGLFQHPDDPAGPLLMLAGISGLAAIPMPAWLKRRLQRDLFIAAMGIDEGNGVFSLQGSRLHIRYDAREQPALRRIAKHFGTLHAMSGKRLRAPAKPTTVHPLGGARTGASPETSVVNVRGEVHGIPGLYVADGSALPAATGSPPSLSIAAWSRHVVATLLNNG